ncbi:lactoylglutathione lyase [Bacillus clarus]|uniref:Glyoxalase-like domain protein n=1 Tax=Bacillus clarus TaxID=2338372 RepID=A0A090YLM9_9BACI|nr:VOC family protein [Bacillus clarus]KFM99096.1 glyoxalase-like domain protein [Bacillus clarus]RFT67943.1 lactoylglutathione lyase [Bacillus clarus]
MESMTNCVVLESSSLKETLYFYEGILGLKPSVERPQLHVTGVWYDVNSTRICFVVNRNLREREKVVTSSCEVITFSIPDIEKIKKKLEYYQIAFSEEYRADGEVITVYDPDRYKLQIESKLLN